MEKGMTKGSPSLKRLNVTSGEFRAAAMMYWMRLVPSAAEWIEKVLTAAIPSDFDANRAIALPMRESLDKCGHESECFGAFGQYALLAEKLRAEVPALRWIIITSDNREILDQAREWSRQQGDRWRVIFNPLDTGEGTGFWSVEKRSQKDPVRFVLSFLSTLHLQLRGKYYILNGNSHYHTLIGEIIAHGGCRFVAKPVIYWLNKSPDKRFLLCSGFKAVLKDDPYCMKRWEQRHQCKGKPGVNCWKKYGCSESCRDIKFDYEPPIDSLKQILSSSP